jgi:hypothetical protein
MAHAYVITSTSVTFVDAHVKAMINAKPQQVGIYSVGTGKGAPTILHSPIIPKLTKLCLTYKTFEVQTCILV